MDIFPHPSVYQVDMPGRWAMTVGALDNRGAPKTDDILTTKAPKRPLKRPKDAPARNRENPRWPVCLLVNGGKEIAPPTGLEPVTYTPFNQCKRRNYPTFDDNLTTPEKRYT